VSGGPVPEHQTPSGALVKRGGVLRRVARCKWGLARLAIAAFLLWVVAMDTPARLSRLELASMPGFDYVKEVQSLRLAGRFGEAQMVAKAGLEQVDDAGERSLVGDERSRLDNELVQTLAEQDSWLRRAKDAGLGALSGRADSLEGLIGAVAADFFVVGDIRDLVIEGGKLAIDGESDEVVLALSGVGLATTAAPEIDWAPSLLKAARRAGTLTKGLGEQIVSLVRQGKKGEVMKVLEDAATLSKKASPGGAMRLLRHADSADELAMLARFAQRQPGGAFALHVGRERGAAIVKDAAKVGGDGVARIETTLVRSAHKGPRGVEFLGSRAGQTLLKPHALVGLAKGLWKGNAAKLAQRLVDRLGANALWALPLLTAWCFVELVLVTRRLATP
jgi:hypothetical protein